MWYVPVRTFGNFCITVHTSTYHRKLPEVRSHVRTSTYFLVSITVYGGTGRYMAVYGKLLYMTVDCLDFCRRLPGPRAGPILVHFRKRCIACTISGNCLKLLHSQTRLFMPWHPCQRLPSWLTSSCWDQCRLPRVDPVDTSAGGGAAVAGGSAARCQAKRCLPVMVWAIMITSIMIHTSTS